MLDGIQRYSENEIESILLIGFMIHINKWIIALRNSNDEQGFMLLDTDLLGQKK